MRVATTIDLKVREFAPAVQVVARSRSPARAASSHPSEAASTSTGTGRCPPTWGGVRRRPVQAKGNKTPYDALRKALTN
jgi:hypothetical protein